ncbi:MAG TPA: hypothetical protein VFI25_10745 [Planctomycetota bacterium]|jgi:hypothetical protein|nr:hypothetical protein [Planctomycetota bacterium]
MLGFLLLASILSSGLSDRAPSDVSGCCTAGVRLRWPDYDRAVVWTEDLGEAARQAASEGKFLMVFRLVGDLRYGGT